MLYIESHLGDYLSMDAGQVVSGTYKIDQLARSTMCRVTTIDNETVQQNVRIS